MAGYRRSPWPLGHRLGRQVRASRRPAASACSGRTARNEEREHKRSACHWSAGPATVFLPRKAMPNIRGQGAVTGGERLTSQRRRHRGDVPGRPHEIRSRYQVTIGASHRRVIGRCARVEPVAQLETLVPTVVVTGQAVDQVNPGPSAGELALEDPVSAKRS